MAAFIDGPPGDARGWTATAYVDKGVSGAKDKRPALDQWSRMRAADASMCSWCSGCIGSGATCGTLSCCPTSSTAVGVAFVSLGEGIDTATPAGRLQLHILGAIAEFERARIQERVRAGLARVRAQGRTLGRPRVRVAPDRLKEVAGLSVREAALALGLSRSTAQRRMKEGRA